jgi:ferredoxin
MTETNTVDDDSFTVALARSGREFRIPEGDNILDTLLRAGMTFDFVDYNCDLGACGACKTAVLEGIPEHRDSFLSGPERKSNKWIMICRSGSKTRRLVLDL